MNIAEQIATSKMSGLQVRATILAIALVVLDGYDLAVMSFTAPFVQREYGSDNSLLGLVLSGALIGMFVGSVLVAPLADRFGRRNIAMAATATVMVGMAIGPMSRNMAFLLTSRIVTGVGIGMLIAIVGVILAEYTNKRSYPIAMGFSAASVNIGAALGAGIIGPMITSAPFATLAYPFGGWRFAFTIGAVLAMITLVGTVALFPESMTWLAEGRAKDSLPRLNQLLAQMRQPALKELPETESAEVNKKGALRTVFAPGVRWKTILMVIGYIAFMITFYFVNTWVPKTITATNPLASGAPNMTLAAPSTLATSIGGMIGMVLFGVIAMKVNVRPLTTVFVVLGAAGVVWFAMSGTQVPTAFILIAVASFFFSAGTSGFYTIVPRLYPTLARATGYGIVIGAGRLGGIAAPILGGVVLDAGFSAKAAFTIFAMPLIVAGLTVLILHLGSRTKEARIPQAVPQPA
ncbi:MAG: MFS transporter [Propionibacteriaceae bacterium]|nr:MFS transporter [Propionibacteriaceae bacterium]